MERAPAKRLVSPRRACAVLVAGVLLAPPAEAALVITKTHAEEDRTGTPGRMCEGDAILFHVQVTVQNGSGLPETFQIIDQIDADFYSSWEIVATIGTECSTNVGPLTPPSGGTFCAKDVTRNSGETVDFQYRAILRDNRVSPRVCQQALGLVGVDSYFSNRECVDYFCPLPNIFVTKTYIGPPSPGSGENTIGWRIEVENRGEAADDDLRVVDVVDRAALSSWLFSAFSRAPDSGMPGPDQDLDAVWDTIAVDELLSFEVWGTYTNCPPAPTEVCNQASVTTAQYPMPRLSRPPGAAAEAPTCVTAPPGGPLITDPAVKNVSDLNGAPAETGDVLVFQIVIENRGCLASGGRLTDNIPAGLLLDPASVFFSPTGAGINNSTPTRVIVDSLQVPTPVGPTSGIVTVFFQARVTATIGLICNRAQIDFAGDLIDTNEACVAVGSFAQIEASKAHSDPNRDGSLARGQQLQYEIRIVNRGTLAASDVNVNDTLPPGVVFVSLDDDAGGTVLQAGPTVEVDAIRVDPGAANARSVRFTAEEDGSQPLNAAVCNSATVKVGGVPQPITPPACVQIVAQAPCPAPPAGVQPLKATKRAAGASARLVWAEEASSFGGYRVYAVADARDIASADAAGGLTPECETTAIAATTCDDPDATAPRIFYQVVGVCGDGSEGAH